MVKLVSGRRGRLVLNLVVLLAVVSLGVGCNSSLLNQTPVISSLASSNETVDSAGNAQISCDAHDPDRDELNYTWSASGGTISGSGAVVTWQAPAAGGDYTITVTVDDGKGAQASREVTVAVLVSGNAPPIIRNLTYEPVTLKYDDETAVFTCVAVDNDGDDIVSYTWESVDEDGEPSGSFEGEGAVVTWIPPLIPVEIYCTVSVYCTDAVGNRSGRKFITMHVFCACTRPEIVGK